MQSQAVIKNETENSYYKVITKCDRSLLQSASGITKCNSYYKVRRNKVRKIKPKVVSYRNGSFALQNKNNATSKSVRHIKKKADKLYLKNDSTSSNIRHG